MYTITTYGPDGEILGTTELTRAEEVTAHLCNEMRNVHRAANIGKRWTVAGPDGQQYDRDQWLHSRPEAELLAN